MGLPIEVTKTTCEKRIFFSKGNKASAAATDDTFNKSGNIRISK
jgi:hypothetical protein